MRGKAQPDGRPALQIIKTLFLYFSPLLDQSTRATPLFGYHLVAVGRYPPQANYKVAKLRTRIVQFAPYGRSRGSKF